jgi:hypothetical protein
LAQSSSIDFELQEVSLSQSFDCIAVRKQNHTFLTNSTRRVSDVADQKPRIDLVNRLALSIAEAATVLGVSENSFRSAVMPEIEKLYVGRRVLVPVAALQRWVADRSEQEGSVDPGALDDLLAGLR